MSLIHISYYSNFNLLRLQTSVFKILHMSKQNLILQVPQAISFVTVWPLSEGWDSGISDPMQDSVGAV